MHGVGDEFGCIVSDNPFHVLREMFREAIHRFFQLFLDLQAIGIGQLKDDDCGSRFPIQLRAPVVLLAAQFDPSHVFDADHRAAWRCANDDVFELGHLLQTAQRAELEFNCLSLGSRCLSDFSRSYLLVLFLDCLLYIQSGHAKVV